MDTTKTIVIQASLLFGVCVVLNKVAQITVTGMHNYLSNHLGESPAKAICILLAVAITFGYLKTFKLDYQFIQEDNNENTNH